MSFDPAELSSATIPGHLAARLFPRRVKTSQIAKVLNAPEKLTMLWEGLWVVQARMLRPDKPDAWWPYLLRVVVDVREKPAVVRTAYWTSKLRKFGSSL